MYINRIFLTPLQYFCRLSRVYSYIMFSQYMRCPLIVCPVYYAYMCNLFMCVCSLKAGCLYFHLSPAYCICGIRPIYIYADVYNNSSKYITIIYSLLSMRQYYFIPLPEFDISIEILNIFRHQTYFK